MVLLCVTSVSASQNSNLGDVNLTHSNDNISNQQIIIQNDSDFQISKCNDSVVCQSNTVKVYSSNTSSSMVSKFLAKDLTSTYGKKIKFSVQLLNKEGKSLNNKKVTFNVNNKNYTAYSNSKGIVSVSLNLNAGKYIIKYSADGINGMKTIKINNYYKIVIYKWKSGADVTRNKKIKNNIPNSKLVKKVVRAAKKGTPLIKFKGGNGKKVFITAGVHGNELSSQVAAMKLIKYLYSHPINGTVYVMPFINPKGTASNVRDYNGVHLNKKANVKGTISYGNNT